MLLVWFLWGSTYLGIRVAVETIPPFLMAGFRYVIAGVILTGLMSALHPGAWRALRAAQWRSLLTTALLLLVFGNGILCYAELQLQAGVASLIVATVPIWMLVISAVVSRSRISTPAWIGLALGTGGIAALTGLPGSGIAPVPALLVLFGSLTWALGSVLGRRDAAVRDNPLLPGLEMLSGGIMQLMVGAALGEAAGFSFAHVSTASWGGFWWLVGPGALIGYTAYAYAMRMLPTHIVATYAYVNPIVAVALAALLLGEPLTINVVAGGALIVAAVAFILRGNQPVKASVEPEAEFALAGGD